MFPSPERRTVPCCTTTSTTSWPGQPWRSWWRKAWSDPSACPTSTAGRSTTSCLWPASSPPCCRCDAVFLCLRVCGAGTFGFVMPCWIWQVEGHPYLAQVELLAHCRDRGLVMTAYSPLGSPDRAWKHPDEPVLLQEPAVISLAEKYKKSPAQIILRWFF